MRIGRTGSARNCKFSRASASQYFTLKEMVTFKMTKQKGKKVLRVVVLEDDIAS